MTTLFDRISRTSEAFLVDAVVVADNVANYRAWHEMDNPSAYETFPNVAPPFEDFFIEMNRPSKMPSWYPLTLGACFRTFDPKIGFALPPVAPLTQIGDLTRPKYADTGIILRGSQSRWGYVIHLYFEFRKHRIIKGPSVVIFIGENGQTKPNVMWFANDSINDADFQNAVSRAEIVDTKTGYGTLEHTERGLQTPEARTMRYMELMLCAPFMAVSFMNCKNVELIDNLPSRGLSRKQARRTGEPLVTYKTIKVHSMRTVKHPTDLNAPPVQENKGDSSNMPLTIWRGHFKDFRDGKGLFGKFKEVYWWDQHVRGSIENGATIKDYDVLAPDKGK